MDKALDLFLLASGLICEGNRAEAMIYLRKAYRAAKASKHPKAPELAADIESLTAEVARNMETAA